MYYLCGKKLRNIVLLASSIVFYAWADYRYLIIMFSIIFISYAGTLLFTSKQNYKKILLFLTVIGNLSFLIYFKYFNFIAENLNRVVNFNFTALDLVLPVGISFYTFQALSYVFDVYQKKTKPEKNFLNLALYICLFPQLIAGPIIKYHDISEQIKSRDVDLDMFTKGVKRFITGLSKKVILANSIGLIADKIFIQEPTEFLNCGLAWLGAISYTLQIYFDFSGYSDMAIGLGLIFGFRLSENFNYPYISTSISEFWRRWHMTLSGWFKEYLYIPMGGNKNGLFKTCRNLSIVFLITGIWHGAAWTFVVWGLWHGFFIILEKIFKFETYNNKNIFLKIFSHIYTMFVVVVGWVIFRSNGLENAFNYVKKLFNYPDTCFLAFKTGYYINYINVLIIFIAILCAMPVFKNMLEGNNCVKNIVVSVWTIFLLVLSTIFIAESTFNPFIYFGF